MTSRAISSPASSISRLPVSLPLSEWLSHLWLIHWTPIIWGSSGQGRSSFPFTARQESSLSVKSQASPRPTFWSPPSKETRALQSQAHTLVPAMKHVRSPSCTILPESARSCPHLHFSQSSTISPHFFWGGTALQLFPFFSGPFLMSLLFPQWKTVFLSPLIDHTSVSHV